MQASGTESLKFEYQTICTSKVEAKVGPKQIMYEGFPEDHTVFAYLRKAIPPKQDTGWKVHISLSGENQNIRLAWNLIKDILIKYEIDTAKVLRINCYYPEFQLGKEITIYDQPTKFNWQKMLNEITELLNRNNIKPGFLPINDKPINSSHFLSLRCDVDENNKKVSSLQAKSYKPPQFSHDLENITIEADIAKNQPPKPQRTNENNIKEFYSFLETKLLNIENSFFALFPTTRQRNEYCIIGDQVFYQRVTENYLDTKLLSNDDLAQLKDSIDMYKKIIHELNYHNFNIANVGRETYKQIFAEYEQKFNVIEKSLKNIENNMQTALEALSDTGSVVEKKSTPGSLSPPSPGSPKEATVEEPSKVSNLNQVKGYAQMQQAQAAHSVPTVVSGQDRMLIEIGKILNINSLNIDEILNKNLLTSGQIKNIYNIIKSRENICDVIIAGFKDNSLTLDQIKNITPEILTNLNRVFTREIHFRTLTPQAILQKLEIILKEADNLTQINTAEMSSSASLKPPGQRNP